MANEWGDQPAAQASAGHSNEWGDSPASLSSDKPTGFLSHMAGTLASAPGAIVQTIAHPLDALKTWRDQSQALHDAAISSAEQGDYVGAAAHGINFLANIVPGLGKAMDDAANAGAESGITSDEFKSKLGDVVGTALLMKAAEKLPAVISGAKTAASVISDPAVVRAAVKILPKGQAGLDLVDAVRKSGAPVPDKGTAAPAADPNAPPQGVPQAWWDRLSPEHKRALRDKLAAGPPTPPTAAPAPAPTEPAVPAAAAAAPPTGAPAVTPAPAASATPQPVAAPPPAPVTPAPVIPAPVVAAPSPAAPAPAPAAQVETIPFARPEAPAGAFAGKARAARVTTLADTLDGVIPAEDVARMNPGQWQTLAKGLGITKPSPATVSAVIDELKTRAAARAPAPEPTMFEPSEAMKATLQKPGVLAAAKAMLDEMHPGKAAFARAKQASQ